MSDNQQLEKFLNLCNSGWQITVLRLKNDEAYPQGQKVIDDFISDLFPRHGSFDVLLNTLLTGAFEYSGVLAELVLDDEGYSPVYLATPSPATLIFKKKKDSWRWGQWQNGKFVDLSAYLTVFYTPIYTFDNCGQPLALPFDPSTVRLVRQTIENVLSHLFKTALQAQGIQARVVFKFAERPDPPAGTAMQEQPELPIEGDTPGQVGPATKENGTDEALLLDIKTMKKYYAHYSPARASEILNALPQAYNLFERDGGRWGPGKINKCVHINSATIGRYLKAFRGIGITEWKGIKLPQ